mgnify:CR=1 FL=1
MNSINDKARDLDLWLNRLDRAIKAVRDFYDPQRAFNVELRLMRARDDLEALYRINRLDIGNALKQCDDPATIHETAPECSRCHNYTMGLDGRPMCAITRRALE